MANPDGRYGGVITSRGDIYFSDINNSIGEPLENIETGSLKVSDGDIISGQLDLVVQEYQSFTAYKTMFAAFSTVSYMSPENPQSRVEITKQEGLFVVLPFDRDHFGSATKQIVMAYDLTWLLSQRTASVAITLPVGTNPVTYVRGQLEALGFRRHRITATTHTLTKEFTWRRGTAWITIFNSLLTSIGYYQLWTDRTGVFVSMPERELYQVESQESFTTEMGDVGEHVTLAPDKLRIRNDVQILGNSPSNTAIYSRRTNSDPNSPTSIYGLRSDEDADPVYLTLFEEDSSIETQSAADSRAMRLLEERSSMFERMNIEVVLRPGLDLHEPIDLYIETDSGIIAADGKWWWDEKIVDFDDRTAKMTLRCNHLTPFEVST